MRNGVAVVGDKDSVLAFKAIGLDVFPVAGVSEAIDKIHALARHYAVIFVTEKFIKTPSRLSKDIKLVPIPLSSPFLRRKAMRARV